MQNIKYYVLAYSKLIYLFLEKYTTLIYLLVKAQFINKTKNIDIFYDANDKMEYRLERHHWNPNSVVHEIYEIHHQKTLFDVTICMTNKYILIQLKNVSDASRLERKYNDCLKKIIFSERNLLEEKIGCTMYDMVVKNINYYFKKKDSIVREKGFIGKRNYKLLYRVK